MIACVFKRIGQSELREMGIGNRISDQQDDIRSFRSGRQNGCVQMEYLQQIPLQFCDSDQTPGSSDWLPEPIDGATTVSSNDLIVTVNRLVRVWSGGNVPVTFPLPHRWVRIGVAAGTSGNCMVIGKKIRLSSQ